MLGGRFFQAASLLWTFEGEWGEILGKMIQKFLRTSQGMYVLGFLSPVLKCWGMKLAAATAGLAPVHVEQAGP